MPSHRTRLHRRKKHSKKRLAKRRLCTVTGRPCVKWTRQCRHVQSPNNITFWYFLNPWNVSMTFSLAGQLSHCFHLSESSRLTSCHWSGSLFEATKWNQSIDFCFGLQNWWIEITFQGLNCESNIVAYEAFVTHVAMLCFFLEIARWTLST